MIANLSLLCNSYVKMDQYTLLYVYYIILFTEGEDFGPDNIVIITFEGSTDDIACVDIDIVNDNIFEGRESFQVALLNDTNDARVKIQSDLSVSTIIIDDSGRYEAA